MVSASGSRALGFRALGFGLWARLDVTGCLPIAVLPMEPALAFDHILPVARQQSLSGYDAAYLELALRQGLPLATLDEQLRRAAKTTGVVLLSD